jgi:hypothetical protein
MVTWPEERCSYLVVAGKQRGRERKGQGFEYTLQGHAHSELLPPTAPQSPKVTHLYIAEGIST